MRVIAANAGFQPDVVVEKVKEAPPGYGLDARTGKIVDVQENGIRDAQPVVEKAFEIAASGASLMMTTDVIVHLRLPPETLEP
jgi:chaperonin GroEL